MRGWSDFEGFPNGLLLVFPLIRFFASFGKRETISMRAERPARCNVVMIALLSDGKSASLCLINNKKKMRTKLKRKDIYESVKMRAKFNRGNQKRLWVRKLQERYLKTSFCLQWCTWKLFAIDLKFRNQFQFTFGRQMYRSIVGFVWKFLVKLGFLLVVTSGFDRLKNDREVCWMSFSEKNLRL